MKNLWTKWTGIALVKRILVGLILGAILGVAAPGATSIAILGDVFVGALKAIAPLLVFFLVISSLCNAGKSHGGVIKTVVALYMFSTVLAAVIAVFASMIFPVQITLTNAAADATAPQGIVEVLNNLLLNVVCRNPYLGYSSWTCLPRRWRHHQESTCRYCRRHFSGSQLDHQPGTIWNLRPGI